MSYAPPVDPGRSRLTSGYGWRTSRRSGRRTFHAGSDFLGRRGDPVFAVAQGTVVKLGLDEDRANRMGGYGNLVAVDHGDGWWSVYAHLSAIAVQLGQHVEPGQKLGEVGNTSNGRFRGMGSHLHFEIRDASGAAPLPGPYRRFNTDPAAWLAERGIRTVRRGFDLGPGAVTPSAEQPLVGIGGLAGVEDEEGLPDEPIRDPWTFDPISGGAIALVTGAGMVALVTGSYIGLRAANLVR